MKNTVVLPLDQQAGRPRVSFEHISGDVRVIGWERAEVAVGLTGASDDANLDDLFNIRQNGNDVHITLLRDTHNISKHWRGGNFDINGIVRLAVGFGQALSADLEIKVPYSADLKIRTVSGDVDVADVDGKMSLATASGDIVLSSVAGNVMIHSASGDAEIADFAGRLAVRTMSGDIRAVAGELLGLSIGTASGDVRISGRLVADGEYSVNSISGDVTLGLPADAAAVAELRTISGDLNCHLPHERTRKGRREQRLVINGGDGPLLQLGTTSGDVRINEWSGEPQPHAERGALTQRLGALGPDVKARLTESNEPAADIAQPAVEGPANTVRLDQQPAAPADRPSHMSILDAIERGEMSVEDGLKLLGN